MPRAVSAADAPGTLLAAYAYDRWDLRVGLSIGGGMCCVGAWLRYAGCFLPADWGLWRYGVVMVGQGICALAQPFFTNSPAKLAGRWFPLKEREIATTIAAMLNPLGNAAGAVLPPVIVAVTSDLPRLMWTSAAFASLTFVLPAVFFRDRPATPPSRSAAMRDDLREESLRAPAAGASAIPGVADAPDAEKGGDSLSSSQRLAIEAKKLLRDKDFLLLMTGFGVGLGLFNAFLTLIAQLVQPCGYDANDAGAFGGILIGSGLVGAAAIGPLLEKTKAYRPVLKGGLVFCVVGVIFFLAMQRPDNFGAVAAAFAVLGLFMMPMLPTVLENCAEATYPIPEETPASLLLIGGQIFGVLFVFILDQLIPLDHCQTVFTHTAIFIFAVMVVACCAVLNFNSTYKRLAVERSHQKSVNGASDSPAV